MDWVRWAALAERTTDDIASAWCFAWQFFGLAFGLFFASVRPAQAQD